MSSKTKSSSTIDLVKTQYGYSIIEDEIQINKPMSNQTSQLPAFSNINTKFNKQ